jgi:putative component of membrane protein insertase Oxa1/YidC/SpoIIIJ protein YidD
MQSTSSQSDITTTFSKRLSHLSKYLDAIGLEALTNSLADKAVCDYQRYISPYKGFSCAHRKLHEGSSCSGYFRESLATKGLSSTLNNFPDRLRACQDAHRTLTAGRLAIVAMQSENSKDNGERKKSSDDEFQQKLDRSLEKLDETLKKQPYRCACSCCGDFISSLGSQ